MECDLGGDLRVQRCHDKHRCMSGCNIRSHYCDCTPFKVRRVEDDQ